jgi:FHS family L-fucose permease-like MFS transporter
MKRFSRPIVIIGVLFFVFGFVTWLGSVLIPYLKIACQLSSFASYLVAFSFYISYTVMAVPAGAVLKRTGYKKGMSLGLLIMAAGSLLFLPAAGIRSYQVFLAGLFIQGTGMAILQTAANPYVTILGPLESAARRMSIMGICNGIAGIIAPLIIGSVMLSDADAVRDHVARLSGPAKFVVLDGLAHRVIIPYGIIAAVLLLLSIWVYFSPLPEMHSDGTAEESAGVEAAKTSIFQFPHLLLGMMTLFLYVGVEVIAGDTIINYGSSQGIRLSAARFFTSATLGCMLAGYLIGIVLVPRYLSQVKALKLSAALGLVFVFAALSTRGLVSVGFIALLGLANSMCWPSIWPLAIDGLGRFTAAGSSLLIVAIGGGALLPLAYGWLAQASTPQHAYWLVVPCYCCIAWYATYGHRAGRKISSA